MNPERRGRIERHPPNRVIPGERGALVILIGSPRNFKIVPETFLLSAVSLLNFNTRWLSYDRHLVHCPLEFPASAVSAGIYLFI